ncbi:Elongator complex protein 4 [Mycena maculata]|uniref:Elongator complex protein 4 n=1 Tax=Mycena maculata TaxID=230809 RepID=A0AAD7KF70_9AGAR|nr:Elongator complex protein 4 [Mycena maculata]
MSFKRKTTSTSPQRTLSTGLPSLDDILGGGLPPACSLVFTAPDLHSAYGLLVQKYYVAQGIAAGEPVCVVGASEDWVRECMWVPAGPDVPVDADAEGKIKIAWRYEGMKPFQTTVASSSYVSYCFQGRVDNNSCSACGTFDLTTRIPPSIVQDALASKQLILVEADAPARVLDRLKDLLQAGTGPLRICVPSLGDPGWGDIGPQDILRFLHTLRSLLRRHHACASTSLAPALSGDSYAYGSGWHQRVGWVADGAITLSAFSANPALALAFPASQGLVRLHTLPAPLALVPPSDRLSTLRGANTGGGGENNLGFKCTRKRLVFETVHLGVEGGVGERRSARTVEEGQVDVEKGKKDRKRVGFQSDVYDF